MTPYHQIEKHDPESGNYGDCLRTCIACLLDKEPHTVPNFAAHYNDDPQAMWAAAEKWLNANGFALWFTVFGAETPRQQILDAMAGLNKNCYYMLLGNSVDDVGHVVICRNDGIVHDPSWMQCSVVKPVDGVWLVATLIPVALKFE